MQATTPRTGSFGRGWKAAGLAVVAAAGLLTARTCSAGLPGEDPLAVKDAIGRGVHAFHAGNFDRAYDDLTTAIEAGTDDPRAFYFRGLAALRLGRTGEADADFAAGADREAMEGSTRRISKSLERVQGCDRLALERFRARARLAGLQRDQEAAARRYSTIEDPAVDLRRRRRPEDVGPELLAPRRPDGVEEVPAPRAKPGKAFEDESPAKEGDDPFGAAPSNDDAAGTEKEMADEPEEQSTEAVETAAEESVEAADGQ